jgi:integrase/recombinase XerD
LKKAKDYLGSYKEFKAKDKSNNTVDAYLSDLNQFFIFLGRDLEDIDSDDIENYTKHLLSRGWKAKTVNRKLVSIRQYIDFINTNKEIDIKIFVDITLIKIQKQDYLEEVLTKNDFDRLVRIADREEDKRALAIFYALYLTGVRVSELLQFKAYDVSKETVTVCGKGNKYRDVFIPDNLREVLKAYIKARKIPDNSPLFINKNNSNCMDRQAVHNLIKKYAGISKVKLTKAHAHSFRHLYGFRLIEKGLSLEEVADLLGHTDINTTRIYTRRTKKELIMAIKELC